MGGKTCPKDKELEKPSKEASKRDTQAEKHQEQQAEWIKGSQQEQERHGKI